MQKCYEYHTSRKTDKETSRRSYTCEKKTYEEYVNFFAENNPRLLKSIADYQNNNDESHEIEESNRDYNEEMEHNNDDNVD